MTVAAIPADNRRSVARIDETEAIMPAGRDLDLSAMGAMTSKVIEMM